MKTRFPFDLSDIAGRFDWIESVGCGNAMVAHIDLPDRVARRAVGRTFRVFSAAILCVRGSMSLSSLASEHRLTRNTVLFSTSNVLQLNRCENCEFYVLSFASDFAAAMRVDIIRLLPIYFRLQDGVTIDFPNARVSGLKREFRSFRREFAAMPRTGFRDMIVGHCICAMLYRICDAIGLPQMPEPNSRNRDAEYFERLVKLIFENYRTCRNADFYARKLNVTRKHLSYVVNRYSGKSVHQWIDNIVVMEIKSMLRSSDKSMQQIAFELNFTSPSTMGQYFKRVTGITPGEYKHSV